MSRPADAEHGLGPADDALIAELEEQLTEFWRSGRERSRNRAHALDSRMDPSCYPLLMAVARRGSAPMSDLVQHLSLDKSTVTRQVDSLQRLGLVTRLPDPDDARARVVELTDTGRRRIAAVFAEAVPRWRDRLAQWDPVDLRTLIDLMRRLDASLSGDAE
ncbi:MAG: MarR family winged helix-turn-helix transcriptional regulator [Gordonia sp. (in: high G+C Gram-positive bacteria)]|uniref:MarR family winged helix-turn-helix transcriptional regulator n=1 Tax=Gordonia sp. (in: high G+C Gram-positive bacteria) TaxID=84139 RepID=UPI0039E4FAA7